MPGDTVAEAAAAATDLLQASGRQTGLLRRCADPSAEPGSGEVAATHSDTAGWQFAGFRS